MNAMSAIEQAYYSLQHRDSLTKQGRIDHAIALNEWRIFSVRQVAEIVGMNRETCRKLLKKTERTGRRLNVDTIPLIAYIKFADTEEWPDLLAVAVDRGTSSGALGALLGRSRSTIEWHIAKTKRVVA